MLTTRRLEECCTTKLGGRAKTVLVHELWKTECVLLVPSTDYVESVCICTVAWKRYQINEKQRSACLKSSCFILYPQNYLALSSDQETVNENNFDI